MKIRCVSALVFVGFTFSAHAAHPEFDGWTYLTNSKDSNFYGKMGSGTHVNRVRSMLVQTVPMENSSNKNVDYNKVSISDLDCQQGYGQVTLNSPSGKFVGTFDYVKGGNSVAAGVADVLCEL